MHYVYVLQSKKDGKWYTGYTSDLRKRFKEHNEGRVFSTKARGPFELIYYEASKDEQDSRMREKYLKSGPGKRYLNNRMKRSLSLTGFTLIETLIYAILFSVIIGLVLGAVYQIIESTEDLEKNITTNAEAHFLIRKIEWGLSNISLINSPAAGSSGATLSVNRVNYADNPIIFDLDSNNLRIKRGAGSATILNSSNVIISDLQFQHLAPALYKPAAIIVSFKVDSKPYQTTIYLRK